MDRGLIFLVGTLGILFIPLFLGAYFHNYGLVLVSLVGTPIMIIIAWNDQFKTTDDKQKVGSV